MSVGNRVKRITERQLSQWQVMIADQQDYLTKLNILLPSLSDIDEIKHVKYLQRITIEAIKDYKKTYNKLLLSYNRNQTYICVALKLLAIDLPQKVEYKQSSEFNCGVDLIRIMKSKSI